MKTQTIDDQHKDILREIGNIGGGSAVTSLSQMLEDKVEFYLPQCQIIHKSKLGDLLKNPISLYAGVSMQLEGNFDCVIALLLDKKFATAMLQQLTGEPLDDVQNMTEIQKSALAEVGNIMCNSYVTAFGAIMERRVDVSVPRTIVDTGERILNGFMKEYMIHDDDLLFITNTFSYQNKELESHILFHPNDDSLGEILNHLMK